MEIGYTSSKGDLPQMITHKWKIHEIDATDAQAAEIAELKAKVA